jgi:APA family basic amino acid/polyamine antiporter
MTAAGLMVLRRKYPVAPRPYRMFGYPITPLLFIGVAGWLVSSAFLAAPLASSIGVAILAAGVPAYYIWCRIGGTIAANQNSRSERELNGSRVV